MVAPPAPKSGPTAASMAPAVGGAPAGRRGPVWALQAASLALGQCRLLRPRLLFHPFAVGVHLHCPDVDRHGAIELDFHGEYANAP